MSHMTISLQVEANNNKSLRRHSLMNQRKTIFTELIICYSCPVYYVSDVFRFSIVVKQNNGSVLYSRCFLDRPRNSKKIKLWLEDISAFVIDFKASSPCNNLRLSPEAPSSPRPPLNPLELNLTHRVLLQSR